MASKLNKYLIETKNKYKSVDLKIFSNENDFLNSVAQYLNDGFDIIELKSPQTNASELLKTGRKLRTLTAQFNALLIIFDRIDIAKLIEADGISLDKNSMPIEDALLLTENSILVGYHTANKSDVLIAKNAGADFIVSAENYAELGIKEFLTK